MEVLSSIKNSADFQKKRSRQQPPQLPPNKRICCQQTLSWSDDLPTDLLETVMSKLTFFDVQNAKAVCSSWRLAATSFRSSPFLMIPSLPSESKSILFYGLGQESFYEYENVIDVFRASWIVGSSNGFLILLDEKADPYLLNFFSCRLIKLPMKETFPHIQRVYLNDENDYVKVVFDNRIRACTMPLYDFRKFDLIKKAIMSDNNTFVIGIYGNFSGLTYCRQSDAEWTNLDCLARTYDDILCLNNKLYALGRDSSIQMWDFNGSLPVKKLDMTPTILPREPRSHLSSDLYVVLCYLAESRGDILYIERYIGEYVKNGEPISEADLLSDDDISPLICPYQTLDFKVYKIDFNSKEMSSIETLGDQALFLGWNHAVSVSADEHNGCEGNSIYFTDSYWERMDEDYSYGGHDMGVYNMKNRSITQFLEIEEMKIQPAPIWVFPSV